MVTPVVLTCFMVACVVVACIVVAGVVVAGFVFTCAVVAPVVVNTIVMNYNKGTRTRCASSDLAGAPSAVGRPPTPAMPHWPALGGAALSALAATVVLVGMPASAATAAAAPPVHSHPILGVWRLSLDAGRCAETYRFREDGTSLVTSAGEVSESAFAIGAKPSARGFYKLEDRVVKDNGKPDCSGAVMQVGSVSTNYLQFHPSGNMFLMCASEALDVCIGPFERIPGEQI